MEENLYKKLKSVGASNLVFGILIILFGIGAGVMMIINGARLLAHRSDSLFGELPGGLIMPAGQICYEKETLCNAYKMGAFCYIYDSAILCSLFRGRNGKGRDSQRLQIQSYTVHGNQALLALSWTF